MKSKRIASVAVVFCLLASFLPSSWALTVLQLNLEQITALSQKVFVGKCISIQNRQDKSGRPAQYVTFEVEDMIKGDPEKKITFKQMGYDSERMEDGTVVQGVLREMPRYREGEEAIVFLSEEGRLGFTAPVGLRQGKFVVEETSPGKKMVKNGTGNVGLLLGMKKSQVLKSLTLTTGEKGLLKMNSEDLPYDTFVSLVKKMAQ